MKLVDNGVAVEDDAQLKANSLKVHQSPLFYSKVEARQQVV